MAKKYKKLTSEILLINGKIEISTFYDIDECFEHIRDRLENGYVDNVRIRLFQKSLWRTLIMS